MNHDLKGTVVDEAHVAADLGFDSVAAMRRWETEMGQKVFELETKLETAEHNRDSFLRTGRRMQTVLERIHASLHRGEPLHPDLVLAIGVVLGKEADWGGRLRGWWPEA